MTESDEELLAAPRRPRAALFVLIAVLVLGAGLGVAAVAHGHSRRHPAASGSSTGTRAASPTASATVMLPAPAASDALLPGDGGSGNVDQHAVTVAATVRNATDRVLVLSRPIAVLDAQGRPVQSASVTLATGELGQWPLHTRPLTRLQPRQAAVLVLRLACGPDERWRARDVNRLRIVITWQGYPTPATYDANWWFGGMFGGGCT